MHNDQHPHPFRREEHRRLFEQFVDEALHVEEIAKALAGTPEINAEQLRTATWAHAESIARAAATEYLRLTDAEDRAEPAALDAADAAEPAEGVGAFALTSWVTIIVATVSATVFLGAYYAIALTTHHDNGVAPLRLVGFASLAIALGTAVVAGFAMLFSAGRNQRTPAPDQDVRRARDAWHRALLHRGILPFMTTRLAAAALGRDGVVG